MTYNDSPFILAKVYFNFNWSMYVVEQTSLCITLATLPEDKYYRFETYCLISKSLIFLLGLSD